jgi:hypothetical protein
MTNHRFFEDLDIRPDVLGTIVAGPPDPPAQVNQVMAARGIPACEPYLTFMSTVGPIRYGKEDRLFSVAQAEDATESKINNARYTALFGSQAWLCIAWRAAGSYFYIREDDERFPSGTVFMTTPDRPLEHAMIGASSPAALARLLAKSYEHFVLEGLWELGEDPSILSEPISIWPFPTKTPDRERAFRIDPGLRELHARFPGLTCFRES